MRYFISRPPHPINAPRLDALLLAHDPCHPLHVIRHRPDIRLILLILRKHKRRVDVHHDDAIDLPLAGSDALENVVGHVATDVVVVPGSRVRPDDGRTGDFAAGGGRGDECDG